LRPSSATTAPGRAGLPTINGQPQPPAPKPIPKQPAPARLQLRTVPAERRSGSADCCSPVLARSSYAPEPARHPPRQTPPSTKGEPSGSAAAGLRTSSGLDLLLSKAAARDWDLCRRSRSTGRRRRCRRRSGTCVCRSCVPARCPGAAACRPLRKREQTPALPEGGRRVSLSRQCRRGSKWA
jgi:hypothetical protein